MDPETAEFLRAWHALDVAGRRVREKFADRAGIGPSDFQALVVLSMNDSMPSKTLSSLLGFTSGATTALVDRLEGAGYVTRMPHPDDRRSSLLAISTTGLDAVTGAAGVFAHATAVAVPRNELGWTTARFSALAQGLDDEIEG